MNPISMAMLASLFTWAGALVGAPSTVVLVLYGLYRAVGAGGDASERATGAGFGSNPDAILLMLKGVSTVIASIASAVGSAAQFVFNVLAMAAVAGLVVAALCWFTGRGLAAQAAWARVSAGAMFTLLLPSLLLALSAGSGLRLPMVALAVFCLLALHTLWAGYVPQSA
ncbi:MULTISPECIES: hypothetical protein [unclassified Roseateles]|uniref:hypothetical protein n=1 Tax=unclassified Roseateles TaxID=2626991 RepID=UPI0012E39F37|nr:MULTISPECIES: hypothetical protein [unclassified Roseateles]